MRFSVCHETFYHYTMPVQLGSHALRLNPRAEGARIRAAGPTVDPAPAVRHEQTDRFGSRVTQVNFVDISDHMCIESRFDLDILAAAPSRSPALPRLPWSSSPQDVLADYRADGEQDAVVQAFATTLAWEGG